jgi:hypothetical protein
LKFAQTDLPLKEKALAKKKKNKNKKKPESGEMAMENFPYQPGGVFCSERALLKGW